MSPGGAPAGSVAVHGACIRWLGRGLLLRGAPGSGKSDLLVRLLEAGAELLADDLVRIERETDRLIARPVAHEGLVELRGQGIFRLPWTTRVALDLLVDCRLTPGTRLPRQRYRAYLGVALPRFALVCREASALARLRIALLARPLADPP